MFSKSSGFSAEFLWANPIFPFFKFVTLAAECDSMNIDDPSPAITVMIPDEN